jgi:hypothetical protein
MDTDSRVQQQVFVEFPVESLNAASPIDPWMNAGDIVRSECNILAWMSYLPEDCVRTMIQMGWDVTT